MSPVSDSRRDHTMAANRTSTARKTTAAAAKATPATTPATKVEEVTTVEPQAQPEENTAHPYAYLLDKAPTALHTNYAKWIESEVGIEVDEKMLKMIQIVAVTRMAFQRSDQNQKDLQSRKQAWAKAQEEKKQAAAKAKAEQLKKLAKDLGMDLKDLVSA